jgi:hypothetical protein
MLVIVDVCGMPVRLHDIGKDSNFSTGLVVSEGNGLGDVFAAHELCGMGYVIVNALFQLGSLDHFNQTIVTMGIGVFNKYGFTESNEVRFVSGECERG